MHKNKYPKPDYKYWAKAETWSQNKAAFLLHGIDPDHYPDINLGLRNVPSEFDEVKKTFKILHSIPWSQRHSQYYHPNVGISPIAIVNEALDKKLPISAALKKLISERYKKELEREGRLQQSEDNTGNQDKSLANRERNNYLKGIGLLVALLIDEKIKSSRNSNTKLSASQIARLITEKAEDLELDASGLKSFDRKITEAIELLNQESNTVISL
jgi:hypothetical protein